jgi:hypothetical protein
MPYTHNEIYNNNTIQQTYHSKPNNQYEFNIDNINNSVTYACIFLRNNKIQQAYYSKPNNHFEFNQYNRI